MSKEELSPSFSPAGFLFSTSSSNAVNVPAALSLLEEDIARTTGNNTIPTPTSTSITPKPKPPVDFLVLVIHGMGAWDTALTKNLEEFQQSMEFIKSHWFWEADFSWHVEMIDWKKGLLPLQQSVFSKIGVGSKESTQMFLATAASDLLCFMTPDFGDHIVSNVARLLNERVKKLREDPSGRFKKSKISLLGHSLGSVIISEVLTRKLLRPRGDPSREKIRISDLVQTMLPPEERRSWDNFMEAKAEAEGRRGSMLDFEVDNAFLVGSPLAAMAVLHEPRYLLEGGMILPDGVRVFNIFHSSDPVAFRLEHVVYPTLEPGRPVTLPNWRNNGAKEYVTWDRTLDTAARVVTDITRSIGTQVRALFGWTAKERPKPQTQQQLQLEQHDEAPPEAPSQRAVETSTTMSNVFGSIVGSLTGAVSASVNRQESLVSSLSSSKSSASLAPSFSILQASPPTVLGVRLVSSPLRVKSPSGGKDAAPRSPSMTRDERRRLAKRQVRRQYKCRWQRLLISDPRQEDMRYGTHLCRSTFNSNSSYSIKTKKSMPEVNQAYEGTKKVFHDEDEDEEGDEEHMRVPKRTHEGGGPPAAALPRSTSSDQRPLTRTLTASSITSAETTTIKVRRLQSCVPSTQRRTSKSSLTVKRSSTNEESDESEEPIVLLPPGYPKSLEDIRNTPPMTKTLAARVFGFDFDEDSDDDVDMGPVVKRLCPKLEAEGDNAEEPESELEDEAGLRLPSRLDFEIQSELSEHYITHLGVAQSHFRYWSNLDCAFFILKRLTGFRPRLNYVDLLEVREIVQIHRTECLKSAEAAERYRREREALEREFDRAVKLEKENIQREKEQPKPLGGTPEANFHAAASIVGTDELPIDT